MSGSDQGNDNSNDQTRGFFSLPSELRNRIYELVLEAEPEGPRNLYLRPHVPRPQRPFPAFFPHWHAAAHPANPASQVRRLCPTLLHINRQMRREAGDIVFGRLDLRLMIATRELQMAANYLRLLLGQLPRDDPFGHLTLNLTDITWANLEAILPLLELIRTSPLAVDDNTFQIQARGRAPGQRRTIARSLQRAVELGERARRAGWGAVRLQNELRQLAVEERRNNPRALAARVQWLVKPRKPRYEGGKRK